MSNASGSQIKPLVIGIAGGTGSGKSTVARKVAELKGISVGELEAATTENFFRLFAKAERGACR